MKILRDLNSEKSWKQIVEAKTMKSCQHLNIYISILDAAAAPQELVIVIHVKEREGCPFECHSFSILRKMIIINVSIFWRQKITFYSIQSIFNLGSHAKTATATNAPGHAAVVWRFYVSSLSRNENKKKDRCKKVSIFAPKKYNWVKKF